MKLSRRKVLWAAAGSAAAWMGAPALAQSESQTVLNLEPSKAYPRNSEGAFATLKSGRIVFLYTQFYGGTSDHAAARIVQIHSDDGGRTWSSEPETVVENVGKANVMSVSMLRLQSGKLALFYLVKNDLGDCRPVMRTSNDEAKTWSEPRYLMDAPGYFVLNNDRVVQLKSGRLIAPVALHRLKSADRNSMRSFDSRSLALWYFSDDEGETWKESDTWWAIPVASRSGLQEPGVVELADGSLFSWARTDRGAQYGFTSRDGGKSWTPPYRTSLASPLSPASIKRLPGSDVLLAIYNDHSGAFPFPRGKRSPLIAALSRDGGKTWSGKKVLEDDPDGWYCYTAMHYTDGAVLLGYCAGDPKVGGLNRLRIRRVDLNWLRKETV